MLFDLVLLQLLHFRIDIGFKYWQSLHLHSGSRKCLQQTSHLTLQKGLSKVHSGQGMVDISDCHVATNACSCFKLMCQKKSKKEKMLRLNSDHIKIITQLLFGKMCSILILNYTCIQEYVYHRIKALLQFCSNLSLGTCL